MTHFKAYWGASLAVISAAATVLLLAAGYWGSRLLPADSIASLLLAVCPLVLLLACALFTVRGYSIEPDAILVHRLFWSTRLPRAGLQAATFDPEAMRGSLRLFGNGGLFSFSGVFRNRRLGRYRAFVTDLRRTVVLKFADRTVVVSPVSPELFAEQLGGGLAG